MTRARATSNYKQVRITLTESRDVRHAGRVRVDVRVMVKPQNAEWNMKHTVLVSSAEDLSPLSDMDAVYAAILEVLACPPLPGHIG